MNQPQEPQIPEPGKTPEEILAAGENVDWLKAMRDQREAEGAPQIESLSDGLHAAGQSIKDYNRRYAGTGSWLMLGIFLLALAAGMNGGHFNFIVFLIVYGVLWLITAPFRAVRWASKRVNSRPCPVCGVRVANGETVCGSCGTDFRLR